MSSTCCMARICASICFRTRSSSSAFRFLSASSSAFLLLSSSIAAFSSSVRGGGCGGFFSPFPLRDPLLLFSSSFRAGSRPNQPHQPRDPTAFSTGTVSASHPLHQCHPTNLQMPLGSRERRSKAAVHPWTRCHHPSCPCPLLAGRCRLHCLSPSGLLRPSSPSLPQPQNPHLLLPRS